jgi:Zn-dependent protease
MKFNIKGTEVYISFTFFIAFAVVLLNGNLKLYFVVLSFSVLHEFVHVVFLLIYGFPIRRIALSIFGGNISRDKNSEEYIKEAIINLSAPIVNIVIGVVLLCSDNYKEWGNINLFIGVFNICPFYNFDGGRGLHNILTKVLGRASADKAIYVSSVLVLLGFTFANIAVIAMKKPNVIFVAINIYLISCFVVNLFKKDTLKA